MKLSFLLVTFLRESGFYFQTGNKKEGMEFARITSKGDYKILYLNGTVGVLEQSSLQIIVHEFGPPLPEDEEFLNGEIIPASRIFIFPSLEKDDPCLFSYTESAIWNEAVRFYLPRHRPTS
ncbi:MAG: hypothetical protein WCK60_03420 [Candidatus Nomurabacteria bacterium]